MVGTGSVGRLIISLYEGGIEKSVPRSACNMFRRILICNLYQCSINYINSKRVSVFFSEALQGVLGNRGNKAFISGEQGNKGQILRGTKTILGNREHKKTNFRFWGTGEQANIFQGNNGTGTPWEGLISILIP